jgi:hypothetical protein
MGPPPSRRIRDRDHGALSPGKPAGPADAIPATPTICAFLKTARSAARPVMEFTVPLCRGHHRELHRHGDEAAWWQKLGLDPAGAERALWVKTIRSAKPFQSQLN